MGLRALMAASRCMGERHKGLVHRHHTAKVPRAATVKDLNQGMAVDKLRRGSGTEVARLASLNQGHLVIRTQWGRWRAVCARV